MSAPARPLPQAAARSTRGRVLIAEDEPLTRLDIRAILEQRGWEVCGEARTGREAVRLAQGLEPDVTLMDLKLPGMDGVEATRFIQGTRRTPVVMMTGSDRPSLLVRSIVAGATSYVVKPLGEDELDAAVARAARETTAPRGELPGAGSRGATRRRAEIISVTKRLFAANGYDATSIKDIADEVGLLKGSLYHHIASKEEALSAIVSAFLTAAAAVLDHARLSSGSPRRRLGTFVAARRALHLHDWQASAILANSPGALRATGHVSSVSDATRLELRFLEAVLVEGAADGTFALSGEPSGVATQILDVVAGSTGRQGRDLGDAAIDDAAYSCTSFALAAVRSPEQFGRRRREGVSPLRPRESR
jgi:DNA-binding NarL/FixJ family response regulator